MAAERGGGREVLFQAQAKPGASQGAEKQEGEVRIGRNRGQTFSFLGSSPETSNDKIKVTGPPLSSDSRGATAYRKDARGDVDDQRRA